MVYNIVNCAVVKCICFSLCAGKTFKIESFMDHTPKRSTSSRVSLSARASKNIQCFQISAQLNFFSGYDLLNEMQRVAFSPVAIVGER